MTLKEAIDVRHSRRSYTPKRLSGQVIHTLTNIIDEANREHLHIQLITEGEKAFSSLLKTYGLFSGVHTYLAMVGPKDDPQAQQLLGYYGELLILTASQHGLSSCWVGATFDQGNTRADIAPGEQLYCLITLGYAKDHTSLGEKLALSMKGRPHTAEQIMEYRGTGPAPQWFMDGIRAVLKAPSARNRLPVHFTLKHGIVTAACIPNGGYEYIDLGIALLHFEIGADYIFYPLRTRHSNK